MNSKHEVHNLRSEKIRDIHLERLAVVYVRQSTLQQVLENQESTDFSMAWQSVLSAWAGSESEC